MPGACMICTETFGNGARIGMEIIPAEAQLILKDRHLAQAGYCAAEAGQTMAVFAALLAALPTIPPLNSSRMVFGWCWLQCPDPGIQILLLGGVAKKFNEKRRSRIRDSTNKLSSN